MSKIKWVKAHEDHKKRTQPDTQKSDVKNRQSDNNCMFLYPQRSQDI